MLPLNEKEVAMSPTTESSPANNQSKIGRKLNTFIASLAGKRLSFKSQEILQSMIDGNFQELDKQDDNTSTSTTHTQSIPDSVENFERPPSSLKIKTNHESLSRPYCAGTLAHNVLFAGVTVHYHTTVLGNTSVISSGPPISLGWNRLHSEVFAEIDQYEARRPYTPRNIGRLRISARQREILLLHAGVKTHEILGSINKIQSDQRFTIKRGINREEKVCINSVALHQEKLSHVKLF